MCHIIISTLNPLTHGKWAHSWLNRKNVLSPGRDASSAFHPQTCKPFFLLSLLPHCQGVPLLDKAVSSLVTLETVLSPLPGSGAVQLFLTLYLMLLSPSRVSLTHCSFQVEFLSVLSIHHLFMLTLFSSVFGDFQHLPLSAIVFPAPTTSSGLSVFLSKFNLDVSSSKCPFLSEDYIRASITFCLSSFFVPW